MAQNYEDIVREWYERLRPVFMRTLSAKYSSLSFAVAEDLYQDAFLAIQKNLQEGRLHENNNWSSYIITIGMNLANKYMRRESKINYFGSTFPDDNEESSKTRTIDNLLKIIPEDEDNLIGNPEAQALLGEELTHTPEPCGSIVRYFYYENLSMEEIASRIGYKNATTAKSKKSQCMKSLINRVKEALRRAGFDC